MRELILRGVLSLVLALGGASAHAADIQFEGGVDQFCDVLRAEALCVSVTLTGALVPGDTQKLQREVDRIEAVKSPKMRVSIVFLNSLGGSMASGMELGRFIRSRQMGTMVSKDSTCASACVLVLAGGVKRVPAGAVVVHSFYSPEVLGTNDFAKAEAAYSQVSEQVGTYLKSMRISSQLLEEMMRVPHFKARQLTLDQMTQWGLMGLDPVYAQARKGQ